jgi:hypothetical protein
MTQPIEIRPIVLILQELHVVMLQAEADHGRSSKHRPSHSQRWQITLAPMMDQHREWCNP